VPRVNEYDVTELKCKKVLVLENFFQKTAEKNQANAIPVRG